MAVSLTSEAQYQESLREFETLATADQQTHKARLIELRDALDAYEVAQGQVPPQPSAFFLRLQLEMFKRHMQQKEFAALLQIPDSRLSEVLNGKRKPNLDLVKRLHKQAGIPAEELLEMV